MTSARSHQLAGFIAQEGSAKPNYDDMTVLFRFKDSLLLAMFDISTARPFPNDILLATFKASVDDAIAHTRLLSQPKSLLTMLQRFAERLSEKLHCGCASILVALIDRHQVRGYCAGDVRMGYVKEESLTWSTPVHTAANVFKPFTDELKSSSSRHLLTRSLRPNRPFEPEYFEFKLNDDSQLVCATDGFWCDPLWGNFQSLVSIPLQAPIDDCTCLWFNVQSIFEKNALAFTHKKLEYFADYDAISMIESRESESRGQSC